MRLGRKVIDRQKKMYYARPMRSMPPCKNWTNKCSKKQRIVELIVFCRPFILNFDKGIIYF